MFLSNPQAATLALSLVIVTVAGCSWFRTSDAVTLTPAAVAPPDTGLPFEVKEPDIYQADFVTIAGGTETIIHFARKAGNWRMDTFAGGKAARSIIRGEKLIYVDHTAKQFSEPPVTGPDPQPAFISDLTTSLLNERQPARFERLQADGTLERYSVSIDGATSSSTIVFDPAIKMIVRHELEGGFAFEMRNFNLEVDDAILSVPRGYRKIAWMVFSQQ